MVPHYIRRHLGPTELGRSPLGGREMGSGANWSRAPAEFRFKVLGDGVGHVFLARKRRQGAGTARAGRGFYEHIPEGISGKFPK